MRVWREEVERRIENERTSNFETHGRGSLPVYRYTVQNTMHISLSPWSIVSAGRPPPLYGSAHGKWQRPLARNHLVTRRPLSLGPILYQPATLFYANPKDAIPIPPAPDPAGNRPPFSLFLSVLYPDRDSPFQFRPSIAVAIDFVPTGLHRFIEGGNFLYNRPNKYFVLGCKYLDGTFGGNPRCVLCSSKHLFWSLRYFSCDRTQTFVFEKRIERHPGSASAVKFIWEVDGSYSTRTCVVGCLLCSLGKRFTFHFCLPWNSVFMEYGSPGKYFPD